MDSLMIPVDAAMYSTLKMGTVAFPFAVFNDDLRNFQEGFVNWHKQREVEISFILEGSVRVCLLGEEHQLSAGSAFIIFPDALHSIQPVAACAGHYFTFIFNPCLLTGYPDSFFDQQYYTPAAASAYYAFEPSAALREQLFWLLHHADDAPLLIQRRLQDLWIDLYAQVFHHAPSVRPIQEKQILHMIDYLHQHYAEKFSLSAMAEAHHVSRGECCRFFRRMMGMTISEYLLDYRIRRATELLKTDKSITEIAHAVGFGSSSNFAAVFKRKTGMTPSMYKKQ